MLTSWAQDLIICNHCENPALKFCDDCQIELCIDCVSKHVDQNDTLSHEIVSFIDKNDKLVIPRCEHHPDRRCGAFCQQCQTPVCTKCLISLHKSHDAEDIYSFAEHKKSEIRKDTEKIKEHLYQSYQTKYDDIQSEISNVISEYGRIAQENETQRHIWHRMVDDVFNEFKSLIQSKKDLKLKTLQEKQLDVQNIISEMTQTIKENNGILQSNKASEVTKYSKKVYDDINGRFEFDATFPFLSTKTIQGTEFKFYIEMEDIGVSLKRKQYVRASGFVPNLFDCELLKHPRLIATIQTSTNQLRRVECLGTLKAWIIIGNEILKRFGMHVEGQIQNTEYITCPYAPTDIALTREGELIYSDNRTVNIIKYGKGETLIAPPEGWEPRGLCCTRSGDILVSMFYTKDKTNKVIRYEGQKITQEIHKDEHGIQLFKEGEDILFLTENNNGDICVSDGNAERVIVLDRSGRLRFQYDGMAANIQESFDPRCILTDSLSHIIVSDINNDCLHILDQNGKFLRRVDNCDTPLGLSLDSNGRLWIGLYRSGKIKVIEYLK